MDITPLLSDKAQLVQGYGSDGFRISGQVYKSHVLVWPAEVQEWNVTSVEELTLKDFEPLFQAAHPVDILLLGCGASMKPFDPSLHLALKEKGIAVELMDTGAACRTYNVLLSEERQVCAALFLNSK